MEQELVADLVGDYLFTDADFIRNLSTAHRNLFQKIYDEIKYLCKVVTAGTKEARQLEKVKKAFADAYRAKSTLPDRVKYSITAEMTDAERYADLKNKKLPVITETATSEHSDEVLSLEALKKKAKSKAEEIIYPLADKLGITRKQLSHEDIDVEFIFSKNGGLKESLSKQLRYGGNYADFARAMINLDRVLDSAVLIEIHGDKYAGTSRADENLEAVYVLLGAFQDGENIIPVQMEIKKSSDVGGRLYMTVALTKIEADVLGSTPEEVQTRSLIPASIYSLADIVKEINPEDAHFLKYLPDGMLSSAQIEAKKKALVEDNKRIEKYRKEKNDKDYLAAVSRGDMQTAQQMVDEAAKAAGYSIKAYHGTTNREEKSSWNNQTRSWDTEYSRITVFKKQYEEQAGHFFNSDMDNAGGYGSDLYTVYLMLKKPLVIDCRGQNYASITFDGKEMDTYEWAAYAKKNRYDGVVFENISDGVGYDDLQRLTTDYVVFDSNRIKSADPVTYDKAGNVIPLSERFNVTNRDIRYSLSKKDFSIAPPVAADVYGKDIGYDIAPPTLNSKRRLTREDLADYMRVGERKHVRDTKQRIVDSGESPILTKPLEILDFIRNAFHGKVRDVIKAYGRVNNKLAKVVKDATNGEVNIDDYYLELDANRIAHLDDHVGQDKDIRNIPLTEEQIIQIPEYVDSFDDLINVIRRKDGSVRLMLGKKINGHSIIVEAVSKGRSALHPVTAYQIDTNDYINNYKTRAIDRSSTSRPANADTVDISRPTIAPVNDSISNSQPIVNPEDSTGAAPSGFDPVSHLQYEYGSLPEGEKPVREDSLPKSTTGK